ncbi:hypothetical protein JCM8097_001067 [Rhodosporidiobolus ruineniae]
MATLNELLTDENAGCSARSGAAEGLSGDGGRDKLDAGLVEAAAAVPVGLWSRTYVCCAVPLYNAGIYAILSQFLIVSIVTGVLCFAAPSIVSVTTPSFCSYILGILCILVAVAQPIGFLGVYRERPKLFKTYSRFNALLVACALLLALALIIISAAKHSTAVDSCTRLFSADDADTSADSICNIWTWIQIGIMGLLFVIVALCELYFLMYESIYASEQKLDHARYNSVYSAAAEEVRASGLWDGAAGRMSYSDDPSAPPHGGPYYGAGHGRTGSKASGLRNEIARGETQEELDQMAVYGGGGGAGGGGGKLKKSKLGQSSSGPGPVNASSVVGYRDDEEAIGYDYGGRGGGGGRGGYDDYPQEGGFRPPGQSSEVPTRRW